jgi:hypothetical protein
MCLHSESHPSRRRGLSPAKAQIIVEPGFASPRLPPAEPGAAAEVERVLNNRGCVRASPQLLAAAILGGHPISMSEHRRRWMRSPSESGGRRRLLGPRPAKRRIPSAASLSRYAFPVLSA